jgi:hypothetical protein
MPFLWASTSPMPREKRKGTKTSISNISTSGRIANWCLYYASLKWNMWSAFWVVFNLPLGKETNTRQHGRYKTRALTSSAWKGRAHACQTHKAGLLLESSLLLTSIDDLQICMKDHGIIKIVCHQLHLQAINIILQAQFNYPWQTRNVQEHNKEIVALASTAIYIYIYMYQLIAYGYPRLIHIVYIQ